MDRLLPDDASSAILLLPSPESQAETFASRKASVSSFPPQVGHLDRTLSMSWETCLFSAKRRTPTSRLHLRRPEIPPPRPAGHPHPARLLRRRLRTSSRRRFERCPVAQAALNQLRQILGPIPDPAHTEIRRWPHSLPQYEVGHLERIAQLDEIVSTIPGLTLLGNAYRGVGLPDLIRDARSAARALTP